MVSRRDAVIGLVGVGMLVTAAATGMQAVSAGHRAEHDLQAAAGLLAGVDQSTGSSVSANISSLHRAQQELRNAGSALNGWPLGVAARVPYFGRDIRVAQAIDTGAASMVATGSAMLSAVTALGAAGPNATGLVQTSNTAVAFARATRHAAAGVRAQQPLFVGERPRLEFLAAAAKAEVIATKVADGLRLATGFWGPLGSSRYLVLLQNPAEMRGTGGLIGEYGVITATPQGPQLTWLAPFRQFNAALGAGMPTPPSLAAYSAFGVGRDVTDVNIPPNFPSVGRLLVSMYRRASGASLQGVIAVDPLALADILQVAGPITVDGIQLNGTNASSVLLRTSYVQFAVNNAARHVFLRQVAGATFLAVRTGMRRHAMALAQALATATAGRHLQMFFTGSRGERLATVVGVAGSVTAPATGDELAVYGVNTGGNKLDAYLQRTITDRIALSTNGTSRSVLTVRLQTNVPSGLPPYVTGPFSVGMRAGVDLQNLSVLFPAASGYTSATVNGQPVSAATAIAFGGNVVTEPLAVSPGQPVTVQYQVVNPQAAQAARGRLRYTLTALPQATVNPDLVTVVVRPPPKWHFVSVPPGFVRNGSAVTWSGAAPSTQWAFVAAA